MRLEGIAASPGLASGPVFRLERQLLAVRELVLDPLDVSAEIDRFRAALDGARRDLTGIRDGIASELGEHEAHIYDAHLMMLSDPDLVKTVESGIRQQLRNAEFVFRAYMGGIAAHFESLENEYLRERRDDIVDCERRVLRELLGAGTGQASELKAPSIVVAHELGPSEVAMLPRELVLAFVLEVGGRTSHGAIVARGRGIPAVVSVRDALQKLEQGAFTLVDGFEGVVTSGPDESERLRFDARRARLDARTKALQAMQDEKAETRDGKRIELAANLELPEDVYGAEASGADGIGLFRTEFFYLNRTDLPNEDEQYAAYRLVIERMGGRPVIFRTMDLGGDKVASYLGVTHETNPFLGMRGIRLALTSPEMFRTQIRAIYRASAHGRARLMFPMVSSVDELLRALQLRDEAIATLRARDVAFDPNVEVGIMIETPSAVWMADALAQHAQFFSIGSNDLIQYTLAMDRDNERLSHLYEPLDPAVLRSIQHTIRAAHEAGRWVGVCGEMAGDPQTAVLLLGLGIDELSVSCFDVPRLKAAIRSVRFDAAQALARQAVACHSAVAVRRLVREQVNALLPSFLAPESAGENR